jgi:hypothetical protein
MKSTTIPVEGDRSFVNAFSTFAKTKNKTMGALVKDALVLAYGDELKPFEELFAAKNGAHFDQSEQQSSTPREASNAA